MPCGKRLSGAKAIAAAYLLEETVFLKIDEALNDD